MRVEIIQAQPRRKPTYEALLQKALARLDAKRYGEGDRDGGHDGKIGMDAGEKN